MSALFEAVRQACPAAAWTNGVALARAGAVSKLRRDSEEVVLQVEIHGLAVSPTVRLYPDDGEWDCDCGSSLAACEHSAAAVIALRRGSDVEPTKKSPLQYHFTRTTEGLHLERGFVDADGNFQAVHLPLRAIAAGRIGGPSGFETTNQDLLAERFLGEKLPGVVDAKVVRRLFDALAGCTEVNLDGVTIRVSGEVARPSLRLEDAEGGVRLAVVSPADNSEGGEQFVNGVLRTGDTLHPYDEPLLSAKEFRDLSEKRVYRESDLPELLTAILPSLAERMAVDVRSDRIPKVVSERPRLSLKVDKIGERLRVHAFIVYGDPPIARVENGRLVRLAGEIALRDEREEARLASRLLEKLGLRVDHREDLETPAAVDWVERLENFIRSTDAAGSDPAQPIRLVGRDHEQFRVFGDLVPRLVPETKNAGSDGELPIEFGAAGSDRHADAREVVRVFRDSDGLSTPLVPLLEGGFARLPRDWMLLYGDTLADVLAARTSDGRLPKTAVFDLAKLHEALDSPPPPNLSLFDALVDVDQTLPKAELVPGLREKLRDYQRKGVDWLSFLRRQQTGGLLADDMGLGKTVQVLAVLESRNQNPNGTPTLVAAPTSVLPNWQSELQRFRPDLGVCLFHGADRKFDGRSDVVLTSHALMRLERERFEAIEWDTVVIDEAQAIKNPESQLARSAFALNAGFRVSLTGTPVENRLTDLWSQFHFLNPGLLGGLSDFESRYVRPIADGNTSLLTHLRSRIAPFFMRRIKAEAAPELPPRTELTLYTELSPPERVLYEAMLGAARSDVVEKLRAGTNVMAALEALLRLRQAACHPGLVPGQHASTSAPTSAKTERLLEALQIARDEGHKSLVFSQWTSMLDLLEPPLQQSGVEFVRLDGSTRDRAAVVREFQDSDRVSVFLISLKAGGTGLNLTAADHVFLVDPWWNPAVEEQAFDRAHRIGQTKPVFVHRLIAVNTVEERILKLQEQKRTLATGATGIEAGGARLTKDELMGLLD